MIQILSYIIISPVVCTQGSCTIPVPFLSVVRWLCSNIFFNIHQTSFSLSWCEIRQWWKLCHSLINLTEWHHWRERQMMCQHLIGDMKHTWKHNRTFSGVWRLFSGWKSVYDTAVYMIHTNICKMFPEMFDPAGAIIAYLWLAIWWIGYLPEIISRHKEGTYHGFWLYSDRLFNVKSLLGWVSQYCSIRILIWS